MDRFDLNARFQIRQTDSLCQLFFICSPSNQKRNDWRNSVSQVRREYIPKKDTPCISGILSSCHDRKVGREDRAIEDLNKKPATRTPDEENRDSNPWKNP